MNIRFTVKTILVLMIVSLTSYAQDSFRIDKIEFKSKKSETIMQYRDGRSPVIPVMINGKGPYHFVFDTGSGGSIVKLDQRLFDEWKLPVVDSIQASDGSGQNVTSFPVTKLESLTIGDYKVTGVKAMVRNYNTKGLKDQIDGVIGLGMFPEVLVELNFENDKFIITQGNLSANTKNTYTYHMRNGIPGIEIKIGTTITQADFDTGNMGTVMLHSSTILKEWLASEPKVIGHGKSVSNTFEIKQAQLNTSLWISDLEFEKPVIVMNELLTHANLGVTFLKQMNITFDPKNSLVELVKSKKSVSPVKPSIAQSAAGSLAEYTGQYGDRTISAGQDGYLYIQRPGGKQLKMISKTKDEFGLEVVPEALLQFERDVNNKIIAIKVRRQDGEWETSKKE